MPNMFFPRSFMVSSLTFRSLIHFQFIFVNGVRECFNFILLYIAVQFFQHHLLKRLTLPHCIFFFFCLLCQKQGIHGCVNLSLGSLSCSIGLYFCFVPVPYCIDDCSFVVQSEVRKGDSSSSILLSQNYLGYSGSFMYPYEL